MQQKRGRGAAAQLAEALQGMSSGRQPYVNLHGVNCNLFLVAGARDQKFVRLAESITHLAHGTQVDKGTSGDTANDILASTGREPSRHCQKPQTACCVVQDCGHAVHVERSESVLHFLQSLLSLDRGVEVGSQT